MAEAADISTLARVILDSDDIDHCELVEALDPVMSRADHLLLCQSLDLCPLHFCDAAICADDEIDICARGTLRPPE